MAPNVPTVRESRFIRGALFVLFLVAGSLGIGVVQLVKDRISEISPTYLMDWQLVFGVMLLMGMAWILFKRPHGRRFWEILFTAAAFLGVWYVSLLVWDVGIGLLIASLLTLGSLYTKRVWLHDVYFLFGSLGLALDLAGWFSADLLLVGLVVLIVYDMVATPPEGPVVEVARQLIGQGFIPGFVLPARWGDMCARLTEVVHGPAALLGIGDVVLPLTLIVRAAFVSTGFGGLVMAGACFGSLVMLRKDTHHPRAALVPLAAGAAVPFLVLRALSLL
jgi:presenilin-like A22 family membrane protease